MILPPAPGYFVTGTDTGVGKTRAALALMAALQAEGLRVLGMKPVATGATVASALRNNAFEAIDHTASGTSGTVGASEVTGASGAMSGTTRASGMSEASVASTLRNADALALREQGSVPVPYSLVNPCVYAPPIAPHLAAAEAGQPVSVEAILSAWKTLRKQADRVVVEGVGGWRVPLSGEQTLADLVRAMHIPVILVVALRLGCISHTLLTVECIRADGLPLSGWIASDTEPDWPPADAVCADLGQRIQAPLLARIPWQERLDIAAAAACFQAAGRASQGRKSGGTGIAGSPA